LQSGHEQNSKNGLGKLEGKAKRNIVAPPPCVATPNDEECQTTEATQITCWS